MDVQIARAIALAAYGDRLDPAGEPAWWHVARVAAHVPKEMAVVAYLHDIVQDNLATFDHLVDHGLTKLEFEALCLLTRDPATETYAFYIRLLETFPGSAGTIARTVRAAELEDDISRQSDMLAMLETGWTP
jgi:hypothetical protein